MADSPRLPWAKRLRWTDATEVLACTGCGGLLRLMSAITSRSTSRVGLRDGEGRGGSDELGRVA
jgi:hypothetical protein